ncbi:hypothetical protein ACQP2K_30615 [Microbispora siamensis]
MKQARSRLGRATQTGNHEAAERARADLKALKAEAYIKQLVDEAPPLSQEQRDRLALLLRGGGPGAP